MNKILLILLLFLCPFSVSGRIKEIRYHKNIGNLMYGVPKVETINENLIVYLTVKNNSAKSREIIKLNKGVYAITQSNPDGEKGILDDHHRDLEMCLVPGESQAFSVMFSSKSFCEGDEITIKNDCFLLDGIALEDLALFPHTFTELMARLEPWELFYSKRRKITTTFSNMDALQTVISNRVEVWQQKSEFETTNQWKARVNEKSRKNYVDSLAQQYFILHNEEVALITEEQRRIAAEYQEYKHNKIQQFYDELVSYNDSKFKLVEPELEPYDADNQTFLIRCGDFGDILLPVPLNEAPAFKNNWAYISRTIEPEFVPNGEDVSLSRLVFKNDEKQYVYDSHTVANYAITDINYNFAPIEIAELDFSNLDLESSSNLPVEVSSSLVTVNNTTNVAKRTVKTERRQINASQKSDVDTSIPESKSSKSSNTFAVIIANEQYDNVASVPYAENDGKILSKYLIQTVGLPTEHVKVFSNATYGNMALALKHVADLSTAYGDKLNLIFYYAGHGTPNERTKQSMLLPVDGLASMPETCLDVDKLYNSLAALNANSVVVLMDACFSGSLRGDGMLMAARGVKIKSNLSEPKGNMVVISASQGDETAYPFEKEQHGLFTYFLLKKLQETCGNVTLGELSSYIIENVKKQSIVTNGKLQTPTVQVSLAISQQWKSWKLSQ